MKRISVTIALILLISMVSSLFFTPNFLSLGEKQSSTGISIKEGERVYVDDSKAFISASPSLLTADGYVYLNVTSKMFGGDVDLCFGFDGNLSYPTRLEVYDPQVKVTRHELNLSTYVGRPEYRVTYNLTGQEGKMVFGGSVLVEYDTNKVLNNQTGNNESVQLNEPVWIPVIDQCFEVGYLDSMMFYWNTSEVVNWHSVLKSEGFGNETYSYLGMSKWFLTNTVLERGTEYYLRVWLTLVPTLDDVVHEFFVGIKPHVDSFAKAVTEGRLCCLDPWYNDGWSCRKSHFINETAGAGMGYPLLIRVHRSEGNSSGADVYVGSNCRSDFGDIRFTCFDSTWLLYDYWLESVAGDTATFWVKIEEDLSWGGGRSIYIYYGNAGAQMTGNPQEVFYFYDDFGTYRESWSGGTVANGYLQFSSAVYGTLQESAYQGRVVLEGQYCFPESTSVRAGAFGLCLGDNSVVSFARPHKLYSKLAFNGEYTNGDPVISNCAWGQSFHSIGFSWGGNASAAFSGFYESTTATSSNGKSVGGGSIDKVVASVDVSGWLGRVDNVRVRKYVYAEPVQGAWGAQEGNGSSSEPSDGWAPYEWGLRKSHIINGAGAAYGVNYPVRVCVNRSSGTDGNDTVYCGGLCRADFGDIRFTGSDGYTLLDYWLEDYNTNSARFWVEIKENLTSANQTIYVYYNNSDALTTSDPQSVFAFFDDFDDYRETWVGGGLVANGYLEFASSVYGELRDPVDQGKVLVEGDWCFVDSEANRAGVFGLCKSDSSLICYARPHKQYSKLSFDGDYNNGDPIISNCVWGQSFHHVGFMWGGSNPSAFTGFYDSSSANPASGKSIGSDAITHIKATMDVSGWAGRLDNVRIRKYVSSEPTHGGWGVAERPPVAVTLWGSQEYADANPDWMGGASERVLSGQVSSDLANQFLSTCRYDYVLNGWGNSTQPGNVYSNVSVCDSDYVFNVFFYKGHSWEVYKNATYNSCEVPGCQLQHYSVYDNEGPEYPLYKNNSLNNVDVIADYLVHDQLGSFSYGLAVLWTCGSAWENATGGFNGTHSWGWQASFMGTTDLNADAYTETNDTSNRCFIGFDNFSIWYRTSTQYQNYNYSDFIRQFFNYTLQGNTIRDALDLASRATHGPDVPYELCRLYDEGYEMWDPREPNPHWEQCWMRVRGDGDLIIPH